MSTVADVRFEFRCTSCYQALLVSVDEAGNTIECPWCEKSVTAPEPTEDRVRRAAEASVNDNVVPEPGIYAESKQLSHEELAKLAKQRVSASMANSDARCRTPGKMGASRFLRLLAVIVDGIVAIVSCLLAGALVAAVVAFKLVDISSINIDPLTLGQDPSAILLILPWQILAAGLFVPVVMTLLQWYLISTRGQSIGKMCLSIKIVTSTGNPPGFAQGVLLRNGSRRFWNWLPTIMSSFVAAALLPYISAAVAFGSLANILLIFLHPPRCAHDHIAGTYVIDA